MQQMQQYHSLVKKIMTEGEDQYNTRTGRTCRVLVGEQLKFNLEHSTPVLTSRKLPVVNTIGELLGFFRGCKSAQEFRALGSSFWDKNANETKAWLDNPFRKGEDDLGEIYGSQWTNWQTIRLLKDSELTRERADFLKEKGWCCLSASTVADTRYLVMINVVNQLERAVRLIMSDPTDRRILVNGWNIGAMDFQALPACHTEYVFTPMVSSRKIHLTMSMRSADCFLGVPNNILSASAFLEVICRLTGYKPGTLTMHLANAHLYDNQFEAVSELLDRGLLDEPKLVISGNVQPLGDFTQIRGVFTRIEPGDIYLDGYKHMGPLSKKVEMVE